MKESARGWMIPDRCIRGREGGRVSQQFPDHHTEYCRFYRIYDTTPQLVNRHCLYGVTRIAPLSRRPTTQVSSPSRWISIRIDGGQKN